MAINEELKILVKAETAAAVRELNKLKGTTQGNTAAFSSMAKTLVGFGGVTAALLATKRLVIDNIRAGLQYAAAIEKQTVAFDVMLGGMERAQLFMKEIEKFSATTPFELPDLTRAAERLLAFGTEAENVVDTMQMLGNVARGDSVLLDRVTLAYGKLQSKGRATLEEINMFTEAGVPLMKALAEQTGVTGEELFKMISEGKIGFKEVQQALVDMTTGEGQFAGMLERQSKTLSGSISTLKDNLQGLRGAMIESMVDPIVAATTAMTGLIQKIREATDLANAGTRGPERVAFMRTSEFQQMTLPEQRQFAETTLLGLQSPMARPSQAIFNRADAGDTNAMRTIRAYESMLSEARRVLDGIQRTQAQGTSPTQVQGGFSLANLILGIGGLGTDFSRRIPTPLAGGVNLGPTLTYQSGQLGLPLGLEAPSIHDQIMAELRLAQTSPGAVPILPQYGVPQLTRGPLGAAGARGTAGLGTQAQMGSLSPFLASGMPFLGGERVTQFGGSPIDLSIVASQQSKAMDKIAKENIGKFTKMPEEIQKTASAIDQLAESLEKAFSQQMIDSLFEFGRAMGEGADMTEAAASGILSFVEMLARQLPTLLLSAAATAAATPGGLPLAAALLAAAGGAAVVGGAFVGGVDQVRSGDGRASGAVVVNNTRVEGNVFVDDELDRRAVSAVGRAGRGY